MSGCKKRMFGSTPLPSNCEEKKVFIMMIMRLGNNGQWVITRWNENVRTKSRDKMHSGIVHSLRLSSWHISGKTASIRLYHHLRLARVINDCIIRYFSCGPKF